MIGTLKMHNNIILEAINVTKKYKLSMNEYFIALDNINLKIYENEIVCIKGKSGAGKSTLLSILSGLNNPTTGKVLFKNEILPFMDDKKISFIRNKNFGFIFQSYNLLSEFTVLENIILHMFLDKKNKKKDILDIAENLLKKLDLIDKISSYPISLSGGEKQRVAIARALINSPSIIFADEPTGNLDENNKNKIYDILEEYKNEKKSTIIMVSHDKNIKFQKFTNYIIEKGKIILDN